MWPRETRPGVGSGESGTWKSKSDGVLGGWAQMSTRADDECGIVSLELVLVSSGCVFKLTETQ